MMQRTNGTSAIVVLCVILGLSADNLDRTISVYRQVNGVI